MSRPKVSKFEVYKFLKTKVLNKIFDPKKEEVGNLRYDDIKKNFLIYLGHLVLFG